MNETISNYKNLANDLVTKEIWTTDLGKEFGNLAQGDKKIGTPGLDADVVMEHEQVLRYNTAFCPFWALTFERQ